jgi:hypothetical protein
LQVLALLALLSVAPMAAYFGWFRGSDDVTSTALRTPGALDKRPSSSNNANVVAPTTALTDEQERARQWIKYVGRPPIKHGDVEFKPATASKSIATLLPSRLQYRKPDNRGRFEFEFASKRSSPVFKGYFIQHPQHEKTWFEIEGKEVFAWTLTETSSVSETGAKVYKLDDISMPKRKDKSVSDGEVCAVALTSSRLV